MKSVVAAILLGLSLLAQLFLFQAWQVACIVPNVTLGLLVMLSLYMNVEQLLWMGLFSGLFFDLYGKVDFGLYLGFYILVVLICKLVFKFGEVERSWWRPTVVVAISALVQYVLIGLPIDLGQSNWLFFERAISFVGLTAGVAMLWYLILTQIQQLLGDRSVKD